MADRIKGITVEIGGDTTGLSKALSGVNKEIKSTQTQLKDVNKLLKLDPGNTELLSQKHKLLAQAVSETKEKLAALKSAAEQANTALANGDMSQEQYDALQREIAETEQQLKDLEKQASESAMAMQKIAEAGEKLKSAGETVTKVGKDLSTYVTLPLVAAGAAGVKSFADVDKTMQLANKTMGNTAEEADTLNAAMKDAAANSTYGMSDAATATLNFARAGLDAEQSASALAPAMNLAAGEGGDLDTVSAGLVATINGFHGSFEDAGKYADVFASACNNSALDVNSLSSAMSVAAPIFSSAGYSVNDAALYMGVMANNGIEADKAANSLKTGIARLVSPAKEGAEMMEQLGISVTNSDGSMKDSVTIQKELHDAFANLSESEQIAAASAIFGKNQMAPWLALINTAPSDVDDLNNSLANCAGTTDEMADTMMNGFGGSLEKLKSSIDVLVHSLGQALAPTIQKVVSFVQGLVDKFNALTPAQQETIVKIGMVVAAIGPVLVIIGKLMTSVGTIMTMAPKISAAITTVKGAMAALNTTMLANPIVLIIAAIAALVVAFIYLWNNCEVFRNFWIGLWDSIKEIAVTVFTALKDFFVSAWEAIRNTFTTVVTGIGTFLSGAWNSIKNTVQTVMNAIKTVITTVWDAIKAVFTTVFNAIKLVVTTYFNAYKTVITTVLNAIKTVVTTVWNAIKTAVTTVVNAIKTVISTAWNAIKATTSSVFNAVKSVVSSVWNGIKSVISSVVNSIKSVVSSGFNAIKSTISGILNGIKSTFSSVFNGIWSFVSGIVNKLKSVFNFSWSLPKIKLPHFSISGSFSLNPPSIPHFSVDWYKKAMSGGMILKDATIFGQSGGSLLGGGEAGDEAVVGVSSLRSMIQDAVQNATLTLSGDQPLINIEEMSVRSDDDIRKISQQLNTLLTAGRRAKGLVV